MTESRTLPASNQLGAGGRAQFSDAVLLSALPVWPGCRGVRPHRASGRHVDADASPRGKRTLGLLAGRLLVEGEDSQLRFDLDLEGSLPLTLAITL